MALPWVLRTGGERAQRARDEWSDLLPLMLRSAVYGGMTYGRFRQPLVARIVLFKWVLSGEASMLVRGRQVRFGPGDLAVRTPSHQHAFWCEQEGTEMCWFSVDGELAEQFAHGLGIRHGVFRYGQAPLDMIKTLVASLADPSVEGARRSSQLAIDALYTVAAKLPSPESSTLVQQVRHHIREGLSDPALSAKQLAVRLHYSRGALSRAFRRDSGMTIMEYITRVRVEEAQFLLTSSDARIGDVARKCGFSDHSYFTRWLRKHTGRLPGEFKAAQEAIDREG